MAFIKDIWNKLMSPKTWFVVLWVLLFLCTLGGTITLIVLVPNQGVWHYVLYVLSAVGLSYMVYVCIYLTPKIKGKFVNFLKKYKFTSSILDSYGYRTFVFSILSFSFNLAYVVFMAVLGFMTMSAWYLSITAYYLVIILMKANIYYSKYKYNTPVKQARAYRYCGIMFLILTVAFSGIIVLIYTSNMYFEYAGLMIYAVATYTFYRLILAIHNIYKAKKQDDLYIQSIRNTNLASALISIVVLQVAMFQEFSPENNTGIANALAGAGVNLIILIFGIAMIVIANKRLKKLEELDTDKEKVVNVSTLDIKEKGNGK